MKTKKIKSGNHTWHFIQTGGLVQLKIRSIEDVLNLKELDQKLWIALACPVKGLEFSEETLSLLDTDKDGRVRVPEILDAVEYIRRNFKRPEVIMEPGNSVSLEALSSEPFVGGHSPLDSAKAILTVLGKENAQEISLDDLSVNDKIFSPAIINGDGVLPAEAVKDEAIASVVKDIVACTGGSDDISGAKGANRAQFEAFYADLRAIKAWRDSAEKDAPDIFFLNLGTDAAASAYMKVSQKIDDFFLRCSLNEYNSEIASAIRKKEDDAFAALDGLSEEEMAKLPLAVCTDGKLLSFGNSINPAWKDAMDAFVSQVIAPIFGNGKTNLTEGEWKKIKVNFERYISWYSARPDNSVTGLSMDRVEEILSSDAEQVISSLLEEEEKHPPLALATVELRKMLLLRRDFVVLLRNFVSFEDFYDFDKKSIFQCGTLYIDGRSCDLCFKVLDSGKHGTMAALSQCYLVYCDCTRKATGEKLSIAAMVSAGNRDNLIVGRNGIFYDRRGNDFDATITKIVENPISIREAFVSPYKKLMRMIQERIAKSAADAESKMTSKMSAAVDNPNSIADSAKEAAPKKMFDVGTIAALGVAVSGFATVLGTVIGIMTKKWYMPPVFIIGLMLVISLPSMILAWLKLRQRNIAPVLDADGWAVNGNVKINIPLGAFFTHTGVRPHGSKLDSYDPYAQKHFPWKRLLLCLILLALVIIALVLILKFGVSGAWEHVKTFFIGIGRKFVPVNN